jgi:hypothetical protein
MWESCLLEGHSIDELFVVFLDGVLVVFIGFMVFQNE